MSAVTSSGSGRRWGRFVTSMCWRSWTIFPMSSGRSSAPARGCGAPVADDAGQRALSASARSPTSTTHTPPFVADNAMHANLRATDVLPVLVGAQWRKLHRQVRKAGTGPSNRQLHRIRIKAKQVRYAAEAAAPVVGGPSASRTRQRPRRSKPSSGSTTMPLPRRPGCESSRAVYLPQLHSKPVACRPSRIGFNASSDAIGVGRGKNSPDRRVWRG